MKNNSPLVSVIIPCRNEERYIKPRLESLIEDGYPLDKIEILVVDGMSTDKTREILNDYKSRHSFIKVLDNPKKFTPFAFNIGIKEAKAEIIILMSAHTFDKKGYISKCIKYLNEYNADSVIGVIRATSSKESLVAKAIAISLSHFFGVGNSYFRIGSNNPRWVDTAGTCYKREVFEKIGLFNEKLKRSQDMDFSLKMKKAGSKILLAPDIVSYYYPSDNLKDFFRHNIRDGIWAILPIKFIKRPLKLRHCIPLIFVLSLPLSIWLYLPISLYFSAKIAIKERDFRLFFVMPLVFATRHMGYGMGSFWGLIRTLPSVGTLISRFVRK